MSRKESAGKLVQLLTGKKSGQTSQVQGCMESKGCSSVTFYMATETMIQRNGHFADGQRWQSAAQRHFRRRPEATVILVPVTPLSSTPQSLSLLFLSHSCLCHMIVKQFRHYEMYQNPKITETLSQLKIPFATLLNAQKLQSAYPHTLLPIIMH